MQETLQVELEFSLWHSENFAGIAKISQGLRKFRNGSENFAIPAKFLLWPLFRYDSEIYCAWRNSKFSLSFNFRYTAKVTMHSENSNFLYACKFRYIAKFTACEMAAPMFFIQTTPFGVILILPSM